MDRSLVNVQLELIPGDTSRLWQVLNEERSTNHAAMQAMLQDCTGNAMHYAEDTAVPPFMLNILHAWNQHLEQVACKAHLGYAWH